MSDVLAPPRPAPPADSLVISGGGETTSVVTEELLAAAVQLETLTRECSALASDVAAVDRALSWGELGEAPAAAHRAEADLDRAVLVLEQLALQARFFSWALSSAADGYDSIEFGAQRLVDGVAGGMGHIVGMFAPWFVPAAVVAGVTVAMLSDDERNRLLSNPAVIAAIRAGVMSVDDVVLGRLGVPAAIAGLLGDQGLGVTGVPLSAAAIVGLGGALGALRSSDVRVAREQPLPVTGSPTGFEDRLDRVPDPDALGGAQVIIEKYEMPDGEIRAEIYVAGTVDFDPWAEGEPWDMASNMANAIGPGSGSYDAVLAAMAEAGIDSSTPVQFTGYSQGAGTVARIVESESFNTHGLVTFGGPTGQIALPDSVPAIIVEHTDDMVAGLGGRQDNTHAVIVERYATEGMDFTDSDLMPGHRLPGYLETARLMDGSEDATLTGAAASVAGFTAGGVLVSRVAYETERVSGSSE